MDRSTRDEAVSLLQKGLQLEYATLLWNVVAVAVLLASAFRSHSIAILGFGFDSLIEIGASIVVVWQLRKSNEQRRRRALRIISILFAGLAAYIGIAVGLSIVQRIRPGNSTFGLVWLLLTFVAMLLLAAGKRRVGCGLGNDVLLTEARVTCVDAYLAGSVLLGLLLNRYLDWWWADPLAALVIVVYAIRESRHAWIEGDS
ncbi:MAG: cation transporter [Acidobacteriota bacterium]